MKRWFIACLAALLGTLAWAQSTEPEEPDLVLPPMVLEVEDLPLEEIQAVIPESGHIDLSPVSADLPEPEEIVLFSEAFDLTIPGGPEGLGSVGVSDSDFFSESTLGIGSQNYFLGDISLFMLGGEPRASLRFHHEGRDGYGAHVSGEGFNSRTEAFEGNISFGAGDFEIDADGSFTEEESGLQGRAADYHSAVYRELSAGVYADVPVNDLLTFGGTVRGLASDLVLTGSVPEEETEVSAEAGLYGEIDTRFFRLGMNGGYQFLNRLVSGTPVHLVSAGIYGESTFPFALDLDAAADLRWIPGSSPVFPFHVAVDAFLGGIVSVHVKGGYAWDLLTCGDLWEVFPLVDPLDAGENSLSLRQEAGWFIDAEVRYEPDDSFGVRAGCEYLNADSRFQPTTVSDRGLFIQSWERGTLLRLYSGLDWNISGPLGIMIEGGGIVSGSDAITPRFNMLGKVEYAPPEGMYGLAAACEYALYDENIVPYPPGLRVSLNGFFKTGESLVFSLDAEDILSAFSSEPSRLWGGYETPGFALVCKINLSL